MTIDIQDSSFARREWGTTALAIVAVLALLDSLFEYAWSGNGVHGTEGALLVVVSSLLMAASAVAIMAGWARGGRRTVLEILIFIDIWGTAVAAYFLENWILLALCVITLIAFLATVLRPRRVRTPEVA